MTSRVSSISKMLRGVSHSSLGATSQSTAAESSAGQHNDVPMGSPSAHGTSVKQDTEPFEEPDLGHTGEGDAPVAEGEEDEFAYLGDLMPGVDMCGFLFKKSNLQWKQRWFELKGNVLVYKKDREDTELRGSLEIDESSTVASLGSSGKALQIILSGGRALKVAAKTPRMCTLWKQHLTQAIQAITSLQTVTVSNQTFHIDKKYNVTRKVGAGAYGMVVAAVDTGSGKQVAIKKVKSAFDDMTDAKRILREIRFMRMMSHPNVLSLVDLVKPVSLENFEDVYIITELMSTDLQQIVFSKTPLNEDQTQWILYQCMCGLQYLHSAGILHRDLKPSNLLVDIETCDVRICDFGLSRGEVAGGTKTDYVVTRWYRAPEIMLAYTHYDYAIDVWSMGCIFGELLSRRPLLPGKDYIDQLKLIVKLLGSPSDEDLWFVTNRNAKNFLSMLPRSEGQDLHTKFPGASPNALDLVGKMLRLDPAKRVSVADVIGHPYLSEVREERLEFAADVKVDVKDIESTQLTKQHLQRKMFEEIRLFYETKTPGSSGTETKAEQTQADDCMGAS